ncbi:MAG: hypothetical protein WC222_01035 [Parachlamydiales bacterium]
MRALTRRLLLLTLIQTILITPFLQAANPIEIRPNKQVPSSPTPPTPQPMIVQFTPPPGWGAADPSSLPPSVKAMVIGKGKGAFPPSINLGMEPYTGTIKQYLKIIKAINDSQGSQWKDLGTVRTAAGDASLSQVDSKTEWGEIRMMHVILQKEGTIYILTAAAKKDEFPQHYKTFFDSMKSLRFNGSPIDLITNAAQKEALLNRIQTVKSAFNTLAAKEKSSYPSENEETIKQKVFNNSNFQMEYWNPFTQTLDRDYAIMGDAWKSLIVESTQNELMREKK